MTKKFRQEKGFTLIELMFSMLIMTLVILGAVYSLTTAHNMSEDSRTRLLALNAARSVLEEIKITPVTAVPGIPVANFIPADLPNGAIQIITNPVNLAGVTLATVTVRVTWTGAKNMPKNLEISTQRSRF